MSLVCLLFINLEKTFWCNCFRSLSLDKTHFLKSSRSRMFFKISVLKNFAMFTGKHLCWSLFLKNIQAWRPATLLKRYSNIVIFLWNFRNTFKKASGGKMNTSGGCFWMNGVTLWYVLAIQCLLRFIACVMLLSFLSFCIIFLIDSATFWFWGTFANT